MAAIGRFQKNGEIFYAKVVDGELFRLRGDVFGSPSFHMKWTQTNLDSDPPRSPGRRGNPLAQTAAARRPHPQARRRRLHLSAARPARLAQGRADRPRGNGPRRGHRSAHARAPAAGNLAAKRPLRNRQRRAVQGQGQRQSRMGSQPDRRGGHHHAGRGTKSIPTASCRRIFTRSA
jgi:hypothetical protein